MPLTRRARKFRPPDGVWRSALFAGCGGLALALAFPPWRLWPLVFVAWTPLWLMLAADQGRNRWRRAFFLGWAMGFCAFAAMLHWLLALSNEEVTIPGLMIPAVLLIGFYLGLFFGLASLFSSLLARWSRLPVLAVAPVVTTLLEFLRCIGPLGFPWGVPAYALARHPDLIQSASVGGCWGLVLLMLAVSALLAAGVRGRRWGLPGAIALPILLIGGGQLVLSAHPEGVVGPDRTLLRVCVAQPDIRREIKWRREKRQEVIARVMRHAEAALRRGREAGGFDLFVWPETVLPVRLLDDAPVRRRVWAFADTVGAPVLVGTQEGYWGDVGGKRQWISHNSALLAFADDRRSPVHRKMRLVPFSERMPLQKIAPWLGKFDFGQSNFYPGEGPVLLDSGAMRAGCLICFESTFPDLARTFVRRGANVLVVITNDFWFGRTAGPDQHADMAILRAVENRTPVIRCANTGISFLVDPWGRVSCETPLFTQADFVGPVAMGAGSFASRHPRWVLKMLALGVLGAVAAGCRRGGRR